MRSFWKKQVPAFLLTLVMVLTLAPVALAAPESLSRQVGPGETLLLDREDFRAKLRNSYPNAELDFLYVTDAGSLNDIGYFSARNKDAGSANLTARDMERAQFYWDSRDIRYEQEYDLSTLTFHADKNAKGSANLTLMLVGTERERVECTLTLAVAETVRLSFSVDNRDQLHFNVRDFTSAYDKAESVRGSLRYIHFTDYEQLDDYGHLIADNGYGKTVELNESKLSGVWFYAGLRGSDIPNRSDCSLDTLVFQADRKSSGKLTLGFELVGVHTAAGQARPEEYHLSGTMTIAMGRDADLGTNSYVVDPGKSVSLDDRAFREEFLSDHTTSSSFDYLEFTGYNRLDDFGYFTARNKKGESVTLTKADLKNVWFHYGKIGFDSDCELSSLVFHANKDAHGTLYLDYSLVGTESRERVNSTLSIVVGGETTPPSVKGDIRYTAKVDKEVAFDGELFAKHYSRFNNDSLLYVEFTNTQGLYSSNGALYSQYGTRSEEVFSRSTLDNYRFYFDDRTAGTYALDDLGFVAADTFKGPVVLDFRAYGTKKGTAEGTLVISTDEPITPDHPAAVSLQPILYRTTVSTPVELNPYDFSRFLSRALPGAQLDRVRFNAPPTKGTLVYNHYNASPYGGSRQELTGSISGLDFYLSPRSKSDRALSELTYLPYGTNNCAGITFTAYSTDGRGVTGLIYIGTTLKNVAEVYGPIRAGHSIAFPVPQVAAAVKNATGADLTGIQLLQLPLSGEGRVEVTAGSVSMAADGKTVYGYNSGEYQMSQLRFVPKDGYTGSVEIPYVAHSKDGAIAVGKICLGVVNEVKKFPDVTTRDWAYKYIIELADAKIINGDDDGKFHGDRALKWGEALKMILLAAGYDQQAPVGQHWASGYLVKAMTDNLISGDVDLDKPINRLQVCQLAAKALKLPTSGLSSQAPFTDTNDVYVQALAAAGIVNGYFENGSSTFKPKNTLTRNEISAIVWRMQQYRK